MTDPLIKSLATATTFKVLPEVADPLKHPPFNPPAKLQQKFVGRSYEDAYEEALSFVRVADNWSAVNGLGKLDALHRILDFGSGWGRITRVLLTRNVQAVNLTAADVDPEMTALVNVSLPGINTITVDALPPTMLDGSSHDLVTAFSVFSHLSPEAHEAWATEFGRLVADNGLVIMTLLDDGFFEQLRWARAAPKSDFARMFGDHLAEAEARFKEGGIAYDSNHPDDGRRSGDFYGWAAASKPYVERVWEAAGFDVVQWVPSGVLFPQAMVALKRRPRHKHGLYRRGIARLKHHI